MRNKKPRSREEKIIRADNREYSVPRTAELTLAATIAAVYVVTTTVDLTPYIGGPPGFITLEIVMLPVIAALLRPAIATATILVGSVAMIFEPSYYQAFGILGLLIPIIAVVSGSIGFHYKVGPIVPWTYVLIGAMFYITFSQGGTLLWLGPYALVIFSLPLALRLRGKMRIGMLCLYTAMAEQVTLNILAISVGNIVGPAWLGIWPLMYGERTLATVIGTFAVVGLKSGLGTRLEIGDPLSVEVRR